MTWHVCDHLQPHVYGPAGIDECRKYWPTLCEDFPDETPETLGWLGSACWQPVHECGPEFARAYREAWPETFSAAAGLWAEKWPHLCRSVSELLADWSERWDAWHAGGEMGDEP